MNTRGSALPALGRGAEGGALLREALRMAERADLPYQTLRAINNLSVHEAIEGGTALAESIERGYELAKRIRNGALLVRLTAGYADSLMSRGRFEDARQVLAEVDTGEESEWADVFRALDALISWALTGDSADLDRHLEYIRPGLEA